MADAMSVEDEASLLGDDTGATPQGSSVSAPNTPSISFNPVPTAAGPGTLANSGKGPVQDLAPTPLAGREGYVVAKSFVDGNPLSLPAETFYTRFSPALRPTTLRSLKRWEQGRQEG